MQMMNAFCVSTPGAVPALVRLPVPEPAAGEVLVRIAACALNFADTLIARGSYQDLPPYPATLGLELAGTVVALGPGSAGPAPGSRVAVYAGHGGLAEYGCFPAAACLPLPDAMPFEIAAGFQIAYGTSHLALGRRARLQPGETLVVTGAAGGVGLTAVEIGRAMGARVIAVARGADKLEIARAAGAGHLLDSDDPDLRDKVRALGGADVVYETVGGTTFTALFRALRPEGRMLVIGFAGGEVPVIPPNHLLVKNVEVIGLYWGGYRSFAPAVLTESLGALMAMYGDGKLVPRVGEVLPLARAAEGLALLTSRRATGKVVIRTDQ